MRCFIDLAYLGKPFHGWQRQPNDVSVQSVIEDAFATLLRRPMAVTGAGRTDAGVNARRMVAHFDIDEALSAADLDGMCRSLNALCGKDIDIRRIYPVPDDFHARFTATSRTYRYFASTRRSVFAGDLVWASNRPLDYEAMNRAADYLLHVSDFTSFAKLHSDALTNICRVTHAAWHDVEGAPGVMAFEITADRFLRNMVRAVVGTLVEVGRGKMSIDDFHAVVHAKDRCAAATSMPAEALFLWDVTYPPFEL